MYHFKRTRGSRERGEDTVCIWHEKTDLVSYGTVLVSSVWRAGHPLPAKYIKSFGVLQDE